MTEIPWVAGWAAFTSLGGGRVSDMPHSLREVSKRFSSRCLVRAWCEVHPNELVALVLATGKGPVLVSGNANSPELHARRAKTHEDKWQPSPTLVFAREKVPAVFCNRCDAERPAPDWRALTEEAQQSRCVNVSA